MGELGAGDYGSRQKLYRKILGLGRILPGGACSAGRVDRKWAGKSVRQRKQHIGRHRAAQELRGHADWIAGNMGRVVRIRLRT